MGMRNMAKKRAPRTFDPVAMAFPAAERSMRPKMCSDRSLVFDEVNVTQTEIKKVANHTGAVNQSV